MYKNDVIEQIIGISDSDKEIGNKLISIMNGENNELIGTDILNFKIPSTTEEIPVVILTLTGYTPEDKEYELIYQLLGSIAISHISTMPQETVLLWAQSVQCLIDIKNLKDKELSTTFIAIILNQLIKNRYAESLIDQNREEHIIQTFIEYLEK